MRTKELDGPVPTLYIFSGLPGAGKTTLSRLLASRIAAVYLRIDTVEQALRELCALDLEGEGYGLSYRLATDNLRLGLSVVADSCNPIELTRDEWECAASEAGAKHINIEVVCSDQVEHRQRVESRTPAVRGLRLPEWEEVKNREYHPWTRSRIIIDTSGKSKAECLYELLSKLPPLHAC